MEVTIIWIPSLQNRIYLELKFIEITTKKVNKRKYEKNESYYGNVNKEKREWKILKKKIWEEKKEKQKNERSKKVSFLKSLLVVMLCKNPFKYNIRYGIYVMGVKFCETIWERRKIKKLKKIKRKRRRDNNFTLATKKKEKRKNLIKGCFRRYIEEKLLRYIFFTYL